MWWSIKPESVPFRIVGALRIHKSLAYCDHVLNHLYICSWINFIRKYLVDLVRFQFIWVHFCRWVHRVEWAQIVDASDVPQRNTLEIFLRSLFFTGKYSANVIFIF